MGNNSARSLMEALILLMRPFTVDFAIKSGKSFPIKHDSGSYFRES